MKNNHFIPRLLLRHFSSKKERINVYNLAKRELADTKIEKSFAIKGFYPDEIEDEFNQRIEGSFANLLNRVILSTREKKIRLNRLQVQKVKKFLLLLILRSMFEESWLEAERRFDETRKQVNQLFGITKDFIFAFQERVIEGETPREYWYRTLKCILDSENGLPHEIEKDPNATQMAWRWAWTVHSAYLGFWSSKGTNVDFVVTDVGMTSENEMSVGSGQMINPMKQASLLLCADTLRGDPLNSKAVEQLVMTAVRQCYFHENFMVFPISKGLTIALINPYFRALSELQGLNLPFSEIEQLTKLNNKSAFTPNCAEYIQEGLFQDEDQFVYDVHHLTRENCIYINMLTLDRVDTFLGFSDPKRILSSLETYQCVLGKRNDYSNLIKELKGEVVNV